MICCGDELYTPAMCKHDHDRKAGICTALHGMACTNVKMVLASCENMPHIINSEFCWRYDLIICNYSFEL